MTLAERLRARLASNVAPGTSFLGGDTGIVNSGAHGDFVPAAVLVPIVDRPEPGVLLTVRDASLRRHAGQVAFPGGRIDPGDDSPIAAALREAHEEIGLSPADVDVIAALSPYHTGTLFAITPVLGVIAPDLALTPHAAEVADIFEVPLHFVLEPSNQQARAIQWEGQDRHYVEIQWNGRRIWGATAAMIVNLGRLLAGTA